MISADHQSSIFIKGRGISANSHYLTKSLAFSDLGNWGLHTDIFVNFLQVQVIYIALIKELDHFGVIAGLFRQIGGHSSRFVLFCSFWRLFTIKMIKSVKVFPFSFWKIITFFFNSWKSNSRHKHAKCLSRDISPWTLTLVLLLCLLSFFLWISIYLETIKKFDEKFIFE